MAVDRDHCRIPFAEAVDIGDEEDSSSDKTPKSMKRTKTNSIKLTKNNISTTTVTAISM